MSPEISPDELKGLLDNGDNIFLIDCREPEEHAYCRITGSTLVPMAQIPETILRWEDRKTERIVVFCHHGFRSLRVVNFMRAKGFSTCQSLEGGIEEWSKRIDPNVPRY